MSKEKQKSPTQNATSSKLSRILSEGVDVLTPDKAEAIVDKNISETTAKALHTQLALRARNDKVKARRRWGYALLAIVVAGCILSYLIVILIGAGKLQYPNNQYAVPTVIGAGIIQAYGLAKIAAQYLFTDEDGYDEHGKKP